MDSDNFYGCDNFRWIMIKILNNILNNIVEYVTFSTVRNHILELTINPEFGTDIELHLDIKHL